MISNTAIIDVGAVIGKNTNVWHFTHIRSTAVIGNNTTIGSHCYIDSDVVVGDNCKIQSGCFIYHPARISDGVFIGPGVRIINDKYPKAIGRDGNKLVYDEWNAEGVVIEYGANIGASSIIMPGVRVGKFSLIGAGSVVTKNVKENTVVIGNPARYLRNCYEN